MTVYKNRDLALILIRDEKYLTHQEVSTYLQTLSPYLICNLLLLIFFSKMNISYHPIMSKTQVTNGNRLFYIRRFQLAFFRINSYNFRDFYLKETFSKLSCFHFKRKQKMEKIFLYRRSRIFIAVRSVVMFF